MGLNRPSVTGGGAGTVSGVTAGSAISGGGTTGTVSVALDVSELSDGVVATADKVLLLDSDGSTQVLESVDDLAKKLPALVTEAAVDVSADYLLFLDGGSTGECKKEALTDLATALAGSGITASSGQLSITETGDISEVTAGTGLSGGGSSGAVSLAVDLNELSDTAIAVASDSLVFIDADDDGSKKESVADFVSGIAGSGLSASSGTLSVDAITSTGALNSGSISSGFGAIDVGSSAISTTGDLSAGDVALSGGDLSFGNGQNATVSVNAVSGTNTAGKSLTVKSGQGTGSGAGGDIIFQTANAGGSGSSANSLATALTLSDDLSATFGGHVAFPESSSLKIGSNAILDDASGTCTLSNIDALDATTEATIESAIDTLSNLSSVGTITTGVWQGTAIAQAYIATDAINGDKIADDAIDSEHYTDGSIDTDHIADNQVTLAKMAGLARGKIIYGDASGDPAALAVGSANQVLTTDGTDIAWADASGGGSTDLNGLSAAVVDVAADSIGFIDANDSNASRKESIADFISAVAGSGLASSSGQLTVSASATATAMTAGGTLTAADAAQQIIAMQVFS